MFKNTTGVFLAAAVAMAVTISPLGIDYTYARTVSDQEIQNQEQAVRTAARGVLEQYTRLLLYTIIMKLETRLGV